MVTLSDFAESILQESASIPAFHYYRRDEIPLGISWAFTFSRHRDSDHLQVSNYETIRADLERDFPEDFTEDHCSHFLVGWIDHLTVRVLDDDGNPTDACARVLEWKTALEDYPVADEEDLSRREWEDTVEQFADHVRYSEGLELREDLPDGWESEVISQLDYCELYSSGGLGTPTGQIESVCARLGYLAPIDPEDL